MKKIEILGYDKTGAHLCFYAPAHDTLESGIGIINFPKETKWCRGKHFVIKSKWIEVK